MNYQEWSDNFKLSFPEGRFKSYETLGGQVVRFIDLKISNEAVAIPTSTVVYNQEGFTWVIEEPNGTTQKIKPLTKKEYGEWKDSRNY